MTVPRIRRFGLVALLILLSFGLAHAQEAPLQGFDNYVNKGLKDWEIPGLAIAIVKDDKVVLVKGYGVRTLGDPAPVDEKTLFGIASCTKAFTAASLAMLVDEGKLKWDDPVTRYLKDFQLADPVVTRELTVRDILTHRSGLPDHGGDPLWWAWGYNREEIARRMRYLKPASSFRSQFAYQNNMYTVAGQIIPAVTGKSWDDFVRERIFLPLGMTASNTSISVFKNGDNVATPHTKIEDKVQPISWLNDDKSGPAGAINSNAVEMAEWLRLQLGEGSYNHTRLLSPGVMKEMQTPQMVIPLEGAAILLRIRQAHFLTYGLAWFIHDYHGRKVLSHTGSLPGMNTQIAVIPEEKLGIVILSNKDGNFLRVALMYRVLDAFLGLPERDWNAELLKEVNSLEERGKQAQKKLEEARVKGTKPSVPLENYAGTYENELLGQVRVALDNGRLTMQMVPNPASVGDLEHWHYDTFQFRKKLVQPIFVTFVLNLQGKVQEIKTQGLDPTDPVFTRIQEPSAAKAATP